MGFHIKHTTLLSSRPSHSGRISNVQTISPVRSSHSLHEALLDSTRTLLPKATLPDLPLGGSCVPLQRSPDTPRIFTFGPTLKQRSLATKQARQSPSNHQQHLQGQ